MEFPKGYKIEIVKMVREKIMGKLRDNGGSCNRQAPAMAAIDRDLRTALPFR